MWLQLITFFLKKSEITPLVGRDILPTASFTVAYFRDKGSDLKPLYVNFTEFHSALNA